MNDADLVTLACAALSGAKHPIEEAEQHIDDVAGLYAISGAPSVWHQLGMNSSADARPLYVGKAEVSLSARHLRQHFATGATGSSTVRRTFAAMLREALGLRGAPRDKMNPRKWSHYALDEKHELVLTAWMRENLTLAVWTKPAWCAELRAIEVGVLAKLVPPLNLQDNLSSPWRADVRKARRIMADDARAWVARRGFVT